MAVCLCLVQATPPILPQAHSQQSSLQEKSTKQHNSCKHLRYICVAVHEWHMVAFAATSCLQWILPLPKALETSTQPAIITARSTGAQPAAICAQRDIEAMPHILACWLPYLACNAFFPFQRCCTQALTSTQPAITPTEGAPSIKNQASTTYTLAHLHNTNSFTPTISLYVHVHEPYILCVCGSCIHVHVCL